MPDLMPNYELLTEDQQTVAKEMYVSACDVLRSSGYVPPADDAAARFEDACARMLLASYASPRARSARG